MGKSREIVPTKTLIRHGTVGVGGLVGGAALLILGSLGGPWAFIVGGIVTLAGAAISASNKEDRVPGGIVIGAGALTILSGIGLGIGGALLTLGGLGLLAMGGIGLYRFLRGLRTRR
jgi:hypothetical protein